MSTIAPLHRNTIQINETHSSLCDHLQQALLTKGLHPSLYHSSSSMLALGLVDLHLKTNEPIEALEKSLHPIFSDSQKLSHLLEKATQTAKTHLSAISFFKENPTHFENFIAPLNGLNCEWTLQKNELSDLKKRIEQLMDTSGENHSQLVSFMQQLETLQTQMENLSQEHACQTNLVGTIKNSCQSIKDQVDMQQSARDNISSQTRTLLLKHREEMSALKTTNETLLQHIETLEINLERDAHALDLLEQRIESTYTAFFSTCVQRLRTCMDFLSYFTQTLRSCWTSLKAGSLLQLQKAHQLLKQICATLRQMLPDWSALFKGLSATGWVIAGTLLAILILK